MSDRGKINSCIDEETTACYIDGLLSEEEIKEVEKHLAICDTCRECIDIAKKIKNQEDTSGS